ncbi:hypothetical protein D3C86_1279500 [compost metagenome]
MRGWRRPAPSRRPARSAARNHRATTHGRCAATRLAPATRAVLHRGSRHGRRNARQTAASCADARRPRGPSAARAGRPGPCRCRSGSAGGHRQADETRDWRARAARYACPRGHGRSASRKPAPAGHRHDGSRARAVRAGHRRAARQSNTRGAAGPAGRRSAPAGPGRPWCRDGHRAAAGAWPAPRPASWGGCRSGPAWRHRGRDGSAGSPPRPAAGRGRPPRCRQPSTPDRWDLRAPARGARPAPPGCRR